MLTVSGFSISTPSTLLYYEDRVGWACRIRAKTVQLRAQEVSRSQNNSLKNFHVQFVNKLEIYYLYPNLFELPKIGGAVK